MDKPRKTRRGGNTQAGFGAVLRSFWQKVVAFGRKTWDLVKRFCKFVGRSVREVWHDFLRSFATWSDPKLEPYREQRRNQPEKVVVEETTYAPVVPPAPQTREELFALLREAPMSVLTPAERKAMMSILDLPVMRVSELMTPAVKMVYVDQDEELGPLVLDKLYRSGFTYFPVVNGNHHIIGTLHTALLNSLDVKDTKPAKEVMEPRVFYIRSDYTLEQALKAFLRTNSQMMLVIDRYEHTAGMLTFEQMLSFLFDEKYQDDFKHDHDRLAVAKRR